MRLGAVYSGVEAQIRRMDGSRRRRSPRQASRPPRWAPAADTMHSLSDSRQPTAPLFEPAVMQLMRAYRPDDYNRHML